MRSQEADSKEQTREGGTVNDELTVLLAFLPLVIGCSHCLGSFEEYHKDSLIAYIICAPDAISPVRAACAIGFALRACEAAASKAKAKSSHGVPLTGEDRLHQ